MTAEIAILNKKAVALAADSAISTPDKIFRSANKIFSLSKVAPVAIMVYSHAEFCGIPWEGIIKEYRKNNGFHKYNTIDEYVDSFLDFIQNNTIVKSNICYDDSRLLQLIASDFIFRSEENIKGIIDSEIKEQGKLTSNFINNVIRRVYNENFSILDKFNELELAKTITYKMFEEKFSDKIILLYEEKLKNIKHLIPDLLDNFIHAMYKLITRDVFPMGYSGIVFAGFGEKELYPSVKTYHLGDVFNNQLQLMKIEEKCYTVSNKDSATVVPFAQDDIISMFIEGIHPQIKIKIFETFRSIVDEQEKTFLEILNTTKKKRDETQETISQFTNKIQEKLSRNIDNFINKKFIYPIINIISILPPNELANFAESLINLTSIKRQISLDRETVGGPTDVALISKGDGLIWIKRKHYFDPNLNHHFFKNYFNNGGSYEQENGSGSKNDIL